MKKRIKIFENNAKTRMPFSILALLLLMAFEFNMKSNRTRLPGLAWDKGYCPGVNRMRSSLANGKLHEELPAPLAIAPIEPDQIIQDILEATLLRVQNCSSPEVAAAAARFMGMLKKEAF